VKITTRIALGLALLTGLTVGVLAYQLQTVQKLQSINEELSLTSLEAARVSIRLVQELEGVREFASKSLVLEDSGYVEQWMAWEHAVEEGLARLHGLELGPLQRQALRDVEMGWERYHLDLSPLRDTPEEERPEGQDLAILLDRIDALMDQLRAGAEEVIEANQVQVAYQAEASALAGARAGRVSWLAAGGAGVLGFLICVILYLSISGPLRRLTRGTREIAEGRFQHRLPAEGRDELSELARDFNLMAERLDDLEDMKRDFVSHVSHELKGPLAAIHETILVLLERIPGPLNEKQEELLTLSRQSATRLSGMITNLLEISRIESGALKLDVSWVDPRSLIREVTEELNPLAAGRGISVQLEGTFPSGTIYADEDRLREVVGNLVGNAIKFSPKDQPIRIHLEEVAVPPTSLPETHRERLDQELPPFFLLGVDDAGPGIPPEHREGVFRKFYQVKRGVRLRGQGVGLGLAICRKVIQAHGGVIWTEEGPQGGALFRVLLPRIPQGYRDSAVAEGAGEGGVPWDHTTDAPAADPVEATPHPVPTGGESQVERSGSGTSARAGAARLHVLPFLALLSLLLIASGCAHLGFGQERAQKPTDPVPASTPSEEEMTEEYEPLSPLLLQEADRLLYNGRFLDAERTFVRYLETHGSSGIPYEDRALWGLAMVYLLPESPLQDRERAHTFLERLSSRHGNTVKGAQARWIKGILDELEQVRSRVGEQQALLEQLTETVEQLRRIDLNRRPTAPRPDSVPPHLDPGR